MGGCHLLGRPGSARTPRLWAGGPRRGGDLIHLATQLLGSWPRDAVCAEHTYRRTLATRPIPASTCPQSRRVDGRDGQPQLEGSGHEVDASTASECCRSRTEAAHACALGDKCLREHEGRARRTRCNRPRIRQIQGSTRRSAGPWIREVRGPAHRSSEPEGRRSHAHGKAAPCGQIAHAARRQQKRV